MTRCRRLQYDQIRIWNIMGRTESACSKSLQRQAETQKQKLGLELDLHSVLQSFPILHAWQATKLLRRLSRARMNRDACRTSSES